MPRLSEVIAELDALWPPERAEGWDAVGTVCGDPEAQVDRVLFAVDPVQQIADEARALGAQLIVTHHPLYLRGTTTVAATTFKGRVVHGLITHGIALHVAHTNADTADPGVSDALAGSLDLRVTGPLVPDPTDATGRRGLGRVCELDHPVTLRDLAARAAARLPATAQGIRLAGDPDALVRRVAVSGGSGDSLFDAVRAAGVYALLSDDLRHDPASE
ncbi:Nif3-like dinuclear metal center hexameric protein, partial [Streptomyces sp. NPDC024062]|uniref:Nif3-like dinuclear metal center hexameric protein n=1 Tax=Streptomyces sp. NPDC024062 TaxID=3156646 RepID=UPI003455BCD6